MGPRTAGFVGAKLDWTWPIFRASKWEAGQRERRARVTGKIKCEGCVPLQTSEGGYTKEEQKTMVTSGARHRTLGCQMAETGAGRNDA